MSGFFDDEEAEEGRWYTGWGGLTLERREALRELAFRREAALFEQKIDARLVTAVWGTWSPLLERLFTDPRDVGWLDELTLDRDRPDGAIPLASVRAFESGVVAVDGTLYEWGPGLEAERDASWAWEALLEQGFSGVSSLDDEAWQELGQLGGPALVAWARERVSRSR